MSPRANVYLRHQQGRWLRHDAARWVRADAARFLKPGVALKQVFPALARKYSASQPRVPAGNPGGGQWTSGDLSDGGNATTPIGAIDFSDLPNFSELFSLFQISPSLFDGTDFTQLAGDLPEGEGPGIGHNQGPPFEPPDIPAERPENSTDRMKVVRDIARLGAQTSRILPVLDVISAATEQAEWLKSYSAAMISYSDPPKSFGELQARVSSPTELGYENHHIEERSLLRTLGFTWGEINDPDNVVRIPTLKHYEISGWYSRANSDYGGLSPREYLSDKDSAERRRIGLEALVRVGVLKP